MSWLDRVRNALPFGAKRDTADNLWHKCRQCQQMVFVKEWEDNLNVCPRCDHHDRIGAKERFAQLFDGGLHEMIAAPGAPEDPLKFRDTKKYVDRIKAARAQTGDRDAYQNAFGRISGQGVVIGVQDFAFMGGSMGVAVGEAFVAGVEDAIRRGVPYVAITAARSEEHTSELQSLMRISYAVFCLKKKKQNTEH